MMHGHMNVKFAYKYVPSLQSLSHGF